MPSVLNLQAAGEPSAAAGLGEGVRAALRCLHGDGAAAGELMDLAQPDGPSGMTTLMYALHLLARRGALQARLVGGDGALLTIRSAPAAIAIGPPAAPRRVLSRFAYVRRDGEQMLVESALSPVRIEIEDARVIGLLAAMPSGLGEEDAAEIWNVLASCGVLAGSDDFPPLAMWDFHELLFHSRARGGCAYGPRGASSRFHGTIDPLPGAKPPMSEEWIDLAVPRDRLVQPLSHVLAGRKSVRIFAQPAIGLRELGEFLHHAVREVDGRRPYPAAGPCYELEIYAVVAECDGLAPGLYHYAAREHRLYRCDAETPLAARLVRQAGDKMGSIPPQVVLVITARAGRVFWNYQGIGYALILQDVGVVYQTMYLIAAAMGLGGCALGEIDGTLFEAATGLDFREEGAVGGFVIGRPAP